MKRFTKVVLAIPLSVLALAACDQTTAPVPAVVAAATSYTVISGAPGDFPPDGWIYQPAQLPVGFTSYDCTFGVASNVTRNADSACQEKQWGQSGIYREQIFDLHSTSLPDCNGGPGNFDTIRLCDLAWEPGSTTPWGAMVGGKHCAVAKIDSRCQV